MERGKKARKRAVAALVAAAVAALVFAGFYRFAERQWIYPLRYGESVERYAGAFDLENALVYALMKTESGFDARAVSPRGAKGLMQLTDGTAAFVAAKFGKTAYDVFDPDTNIAFGCYYLWYLSKKFADPATALAAYNAGEGNVAMWLKDDRYSADGKTLFSIPYRETKNHVRKTLRYREKYQKIYKM